MKTIESKVVYWLETLRENKNNKWEIIRSDLFKTDTKGVYPWYFFIDSIRDYCFKNKNYSLEYKTAMDKYQKDFKLTF